MGSLTKIYAAHNPLKKQFSIFIRNISVAKQSLTAEIETNNTIASSTTLNDGQLSELKIDDNGIATLTLKSSPVNALGIELFKEMKESLHKLQKEKPKGFILTSSIKTIFSAGLDLKELYKPDQDRIIRLWTLLQDVCIGLYTANYPTVAAMNGHSIAGGCALAFACEYRIMLPKYMIGLNETKVGLHVPRWLIATTKNILPRRLAEAALLEGRLFSTVEALKFGLIDEIAKDDDDLKAKAKLFFNNFDRVESVARATTKQYLRCKDVQEFKAFRENDLETFLFIVNQDKFQNNLGKYIEELRKKNGN